jgi:hypothetical protein
MRVTINVRSPAGTIERLDLDGPSISIGSGPHCLVRLPQDQAGSDHLRLDWTPNGLVGTIASPQALVGLNGALFQQGLVPSGSVLTVGSYQMQVITAQAVAAGDANANKRGSSFYVLVALVAMGLAAVFFMQNQSTAKVALFQGEEAPALWEKPPTCTQQGAPALAFAKDRLGVALAKRTRRPFVVQDGIQAVNEFRMAAACYRAGGSAEDGRRTDVLAKTLEDDLVLDYRKRQLAIEYHVDMQDFEAALRDTRALIAMTEKREGPYRTRLLEIERKLQLKVGRDTK